MQDPDEPEKDVPAPPGRPRLPWWLTPAYWREFSWRDLSWRGLAWGGPGSWRERPSRFEPGPLGLLGVMLAAMAVTLLLVQSGSGGMGGTGGEQADGPVAVPGPPDGELRVMVVGDSLSQGSSGDYTWRYRLWTHLRETGVDADFVGPYDDMYGLADDDFGDHTYADPEFDTDHAARWGTSARDLGTDAARVAAEHEPQYLLLLAGTEDILSGAGADNALEGIGQTVSTVRVVLGQTRFVVGELPPVEGSGDDGRVNAEIDQFNMGVVDLAEQLTSESSPVVVARVAADYASAHDNWDEARPNARGEVKIAAAFADALAEPLGVGEAYPRPLRVPSVGPLTAPEPTAEESDDGLVLSWDAVPGATDYRVRQRRVDPDPDEEAVLPAEVEVEDEDGRRSVLVEALFSGARYEFVVHSLKGRDEGAESEPLQLVWDDDPPPGPTGVRVRDGGGTVVWDPVGAASHYEVWVRALDCAPGSGFRRPRDAVDVDGSAEPGDGEDGEDDKDDEVPPTGGSGVPRPDLDSDATPTPRPEPAPDPPDPPVSTPGGADCERRDGRGPEDGEGWRTMGSTGEGTSWETTVSGPYEVVVRSYRDYVEGGFSGSALLSER